LCYCGPVLHTRADGGESTREPLQFGAEIYGHAGLEADLEVLDLALDGLQAAGIDDVLLDLGDARIVRALLDGSAIDGSLIDALARKDAAALAEVSGLLPPAVQQSLATLLQLYGGAEVLDAARAALPAEVPIARALDDLVWLASHVKLAHPGVRVSFDLADMSGYAYYSGARFSLYGARVNAALARGGRYDEVGAVFGRNRPAVGFSLDVKAVAAAAPAGIAAVAIRAPWGEGAELRAAIRRLREQGQMVVCTLPGHEHEAQEYECDRELIEVDGRWVLRAL
jgi:ATP phosphoribosyltransferase regulatory subunit